MNSALLSLRALAALFVIPALSIGACANATDPDGSGGSTSGGKAGSSSGGSSSGGATNGGASTGGSTSGGSTSGGSSTGGSATGGSSSGGSNTGGSGNGGSAGSGGSSSGGQGGKSGSAGAGNAGGGGNADCTPGTGTTELGNGLVRDNATCLVWQKPKTFSGKWDDTKKYCEDLKAGGFDDFRVPSVEELASWPGTDAQGMLTSPRYVKPTDTEPASNYHVCAVNWDSGKPGCYWWGSQNSTGTVCVRGPVWDKVKLPPPAACVTACYDKIANEGWVIYP